MLRAAIALVLLPGCYLLTLRERVEDQAPAQGRELSASFDPPGPSSELSVRLVGVTDAGAAIDVFAGGECDGGAFANLTASTSGAFSLDVEATQNSTTVLSVQRRGSSRCVAASYINDSIAPSLLVTFLPGLVSSSPTPTFTVQTEPGASVRFFTDGVCGAFVSETTADASGSAALPVVAALNQQTVASTRVVDLAGNATACVPATYTHDDVPPSASLTIANDGSEVLTLTVGSDAGAGTAESTTLACVSHDFRECEAAFDANAFVVTSAVMGLTGPQHTPGRRYFGRVVVTDAAGNAGEARASFARPSRTTVRSMMASGPGGCAILADGTARCFGSNVSSQIVNDMTVVVDFTAPRTLRTQDNKAIGPLRAVALGDRSISVIDAKGRIWSQGLNTQGLLANAQQFGVGAPAGEVGFMVESEIHERNVTQSFDPGTRLLAASKVALTPNSACALVQTGEVYCWGQDVGGRLGRGGAVPVAPAIDRRTPMPVLIQGTIGLSGSTGNVALSDVVDMDVGAENGCAVLSTGRVRCWGTGDFGTVGNSGTTDSSLAVEVVLANGDPLENAVTVDVGGFHACATTTSGRAFCWGRNDFGQLGQDLSTTLSAVALPVVNVIGSEKIVSVSAGGDTLGYATCATTADGRVFCWGSNHEGMLGRPLGVGSFPTPGLVVDGAAPLQGAVSVHVANGGACALLANGTAKCWSEFPDIGVAIRDFVLTQIPSDPSAPAPSVSELVSAAETTCARLTTGEVYCAGALGGSSRFELVALPSSARRLFATTDAVCAQLGDGSVHCFGNNAAGQLATADTSASVVAPSLASVWKDATSLTGGSAFTCGLFRAQINPVACRGDSADNKLGGTVLLNNGNTAAALSFGVRELSSGARHTCATVFDTVNEQSRVQCWGNNAENQLGRGDVVNLAAFEPVETSNNVAFLAKNRTLMSGGNHTCAASTDDGGVRCWGRTAENQSSTISFGLTSFVAVAGQTNLGTPNAGIMRLASGGRHTCGVRFDGVPVCWGANEQNQARAAVFAPSVLAADTSVTDATSIVAGEAHTCVLLTDGSVKCMGDNGKGQLGTGDAADKSVFSTPLDFP